MSSSNLVIFCKSYIGDILRADKLVRSIEKHNVDNIPVHFSVPAKDISEFKSKLGQGVTLHSDEEIFASFADYGKLNASTVEPHLIQQIVKIGFYRLGVSPCYSVIDSDSYFIRPFSMSDFMQGEVPYTIMHEGKDLLSFSVRAGISKIKRNFHKERELYKSFFGRKDLNYDFGPTPVIWASSVWRSLEEESLKASNMNIFDLIQAYPSELQMYGEALLQYGDFPIRPREPLFKVFHYKEQYSESLQLGEDEHMLANNYMGIVMQSNWQYDLDIVRRKKRSWKTLWFKR